ncbi:MAG: hypothetical protein WCO44_02765 [Bacteroidota bacterium]
MVVILAGLAGCRVIRDNKMDGAIIGDNNFIINMPVSNQKYEKTDINDFVSYHSVIIKQIEDRISLYQAQNEQLQKDYNAGKVKWKTYDKKQGEIKKNTDNLENQKKKAKEALDLWKELSYVKEPVSHTPALALDSTNKKKTEPVKVAKYRGDSDELNQFTSNCYKTSFSGITFLTVRSRPLTQSEINSCNQCRSTISTNGITTKVEYEDMTKPSCILKKALDDKTIVAFVMDGDLVQLIESKPSFTKIRLSGSNKEGWIAARFSQKPTLVKTTCPK